MVGSQRDAKNLEKGWLWGGQALTAGDPGSEGRGWGWTEHTELGCGMLWCGATLLCP